MLTLALGIGASSAIFCLMDAHWLHPMRVPNTGELVRLFTITPQDAAGPFTYPEYQQLAQHATALKSVVALGGRGSLMPRPDGTSALLLTNVVSTNFFQALGVRPVLGRAFTPADAATLRTHPAVLLGFSFWKREFGGDPNIVGRQITLLRGKDHRNAVDVWGVLPPEFKGIDNGEDRDLWMAAETWAAVASEGDLTSTKFAWFNLVGRLAPGATVARLNEQVSVMAKAWAADDPARNHDRGARAVSDFRYRMESAGTNGLVLLAIVASIVLLAAVNVAHLLLARAIRRGPEVGLRLALGARRLVLARQLLIENFLLCILSLAAGIAVAAATAALLPRLMVSEP
ncbi:MAG TPA: ABC transporter permease, partial [Steroidobacteraceae bacterium]